MHVYVRAHECVCMFMNACNHVIACMSVRALMHASIDGQRVRRWWEGGDHEGGVGLMCWWECTSGGKRAKATQKSIPHARCSSVEGGGGDVAGVERSDPLDPLLHKVEGEDGAG